jgi:hypothetical protein
VATFHLELRCLLRFVLCTTKVDPVQFTAGVSSPHRRLQRIPMRCVNDAIRATKRMLNLTHTIREAGVCKSGVLLEGGRNLALVRLIWSCSWQCELWH